MTFPGAPASRRQVGNRKPEFFVETPALPGTALRFRNSSHELFWRAVSACSGVRANFSLGFRTLVAVVTALFLLSSLPVSGQKSSSPTNPPSTNIAVAAPPSPPPATTSPPPPAAPVPGKDIWDRSNVIAAIVSAIGTVAAAIAAFWSYQSAKQAEITAKAQRLSDLWPEMDKLRYLADDELKRLNDQTVADIVLANVNAMEKLGLWWHASLIERTITAHELGTGYLELYEKINGLGTLEKLNRTGAELIGENPFATELYLELPKYLAAKTPKDRQPLP